MFNDSFTKTAGFSTGWKTKARWKNWPDYLGKAHDNQKAVGLHPTEHDQSPLNP